MPCCTASLLRSVGVNARNILNLSWLVRASLMTANDTTMKPLARQEARISFMSPVNSPITARSGDTLSASSLLVLSVVFPTLKVKPLWPIFDHHDRQ